MDPNEFREDKEIDPSQLDVECVRLGERTYKWAQAAIEAEKVEEEAKFKMGLAEARLEIECRKNPENFGLTRVTDASVKAAVLSHPDVSAAFKKWLDAKRNHKLLQAAVRVMDTKKRMLQGLITLHGQQYFAGPSVPRDLVAEWLESQKQGSDKVNELQRKRTRRRT